MAPAPIRPRATKVSVVEVAPVKARPAAGTGSAAGSAAGSVAAGLGSVPKPDGPPTGSGLTVKGPAYGDAAATIGAAAGVGVGVGVGAAADVYTRT